MTDLIFTAREVFRPFLTSGKRFGVMVAHRRCGKTVACVQKLIMKSMALKMVAGRNAPGRYAYVGPYLGQAKEVAWEYLKRLGEPVITNKNEGELWVELVTGSRIRVHGADNPDRLRGGYLDGVILDEYADMRPLYGAVIRPMLADYEGWATFIGTPKGRNEFHRRWEEALSDDRWFTGMYKASETGLLSDAEIKDMTRDMSPEEIEQELECSFDAAIKGAYYAKTIAEAERTGRICEVPIVSDIPIQAAWDLGIGDSTAIWIFQCVGNEIRVLDAFENSGFGLEWYVDELHRRGWGSGSELSGGSVKHWLPHDAKVRELTTGRSRVEFLVSLGLKVDLVPNLGIDDGINAVRMMLSQCFFDREKTADGVEALRQYKTEYNEKTKAYTDNPRHDWTSHFADAFRYLAIAAREQRRPDLDKPKPIGIPLPELTMSEFMDIEDRPENEERV